MMVTTFMDPEKASPVGSACHGGRTNKAVRGGVEPTASVDFCVGGRMSFHHEPTKLQRREPEMDILARLDETRSEVNVLEHPFYQRWVAGTLSPQDLARYSAQYRHAVVALADASAAAAEQAGPRHADGLRRHAEEERAHVALWDGFAAACERNAPDVVGTAGAATPRTAACTRAWMAGEGLLERLAVLYAIEASQPEISRTKLEGLREHYPYIEEGPATEYFSLHELLDVEHAAAAGELIGELMAGSPDAEAVAERMIAGARAALRGNWELLDGVEADG